MTKLIIKILVILILLILLLSGCESLCPDELSLYGERTDMGEFGIAPTAGVSITFYLGKKK